MAAAVTMTGLEFDALSLEQSRLLELLDGEIVQMSSPTIERHRIVFRILRALDEQLTGRGAIVAQDVEFAVTSDARLRPDVWAVLPPRAAEIDPSRVPIPGAPDLAVEVISPSESGAMSMRKVNFYLDHGTRELWQVYPDTREVVVHGSQSEMRKCRGGERLLSWLLPDFTVPVSRFFS